MVVGSSCTGTTLPLQLHPKEEKRKFLVSHVVESGHWTINYIVERDLTKKVLRYSWEYVEVRRKSRHKREVCYNRGHVEV